MVNRELIRAKVLQLVYAYHLNDDKALDVALREVATSLTQADDLYLLMLNLIVVITNEERQRYDIRCQKARREGRSQPSARFINNRFVAQLAENSTLCHANEKNKYDWSEEIDYIRRLCDLIEQTDTYRDYLAAADDNYAADREVWRKLYKQILTDNDEIDTLLEEKALYWNDDKDIIDTFVLKTIKRFDPEQGSAQPLLLADNAADEVTFAQTLFRSTVENSDIYHHYLEAASQHWDLGRMPLIDTIIMTMAIAEMITFVEIPLSVTINEYVELSKAYSTPKSGTFINAMLDSIAHTLHADGVILKQL